MWLLGWPFYFIRARFRALVRCVRPVTLLPYNDSADATIGTKIGIRGVPTGHRRRPVASREAEEAAVRSGQEIDK